MYTLKKGKKKKGKRRRRRRKKKKKKNKKNKKKKKKGQKNKTKTIKFKIKCMYNIDDVNMSHRYVHEECRFLEGSVKFTRKLSAHVPC